MRLPQEVFLLLLGLFVTGPIHAVLANTEIVNFDASLGPDLPYPEVLNRLVLNSTNPQALLRVQPALLDTPITAVCEPVSVDTLGSCPHEAWLAIELDDGPWSAYSKYTLRISWPASYPAEFFIDTYSPEDLTDTAQPTDAPLTRRKFARIRLINEGVLTPSPANRNRTIDPVPFIVSVEPLLLGIVPESLLPTVLFLLGLVAIAGFVVLPHIQRYLSAVAERIRVESAAAEERRRR